MTFVNIRSGLNNVGEYQASGLPWVTSSVATATPSKLDFPFVTNRITFKALGDGVKFGFTLNGIQGSNYFTLDASQSLTMDIRCKTLYVSSGGSTGYEIFAGLTTILERDFPILTGSGIYNSASYTNEYGYGLSGSAGAGTGLG